MKIILFRFTLVIVAITFGCGLFALLAYAGNKSKGPLDDLFTTVNSRVASLEKKMISTRESRSNALQWFNRYRNNTVLMNAPDTFFLGAYDDNTAESFESI